MLLIDLQMLVMRMAVRVLMFMRVLVSMLMSFMFMMVLNTRGAARGGAVV